MFLLFMSRFTTALMKEHMFNSKSKDKTGLNVVGGTPVLLKYLVDLKEVGKQILYSIFGKYLSLKQSYFVYTLLSSSIF